MGFANFCPPYQSVSFSEQRLCFTFWEHTFVICSMFLWLQEDKYFANNFAQNSFFIKKQTSCNLSWLRRAPKKSTFFVVYVLLQWVVRKKGGPFEKKATTQLSNRCEVKNIWFWQSLSCLNIYAKERLKTSSTIKVFISYLQSHICKVR